jgi:hypothetical protein
MAREGKPLIVIQRQLGHSNLGIASVNLQGIDSGEIIETVPRPTRANDPSQRVATGVIETEPALLIRAEHQRPCPAPACASQWGRGCQAGP